MQERYSDTHKRITDGVSEAVVVIKNEREVKREVPREVKDECAGKNSGGVVINNLPTEVRGVKRNSNV